MSIATKLGDTGLTGLIGGARVSKADLRVEAYGTVDELNSTLGLARSLCADEEIRQWTETIQRSLFRVGAALATPPEDRKGEPAVKAADVTFATGLVEELESIEGILADWSLPGARVDSAAFEVARTVCRRAERCVVRLQESHAHGESGRRFEEEPGGPNNKLAGSEDVLPELLAYLNRLSDVLWLFGRVLEHRAGIDARLRGDDPSARGWTRAW